MQETGDRPRFIIGLLSFGLPFSGIKTILFWHKAVTRRVTVPCVRNSTAGGFSGKSTGKVGKKQKIKRKELENWGLSPVSAIDNAKKEV